MNQKSATSLQNVMGGLPFIQAISTPTNGIASLTPTLQNNWQKRWLNQSSCQHTTEQMENTQMEQDSASIAETTATSPSSETPDPSNQPSPSPSPKPWEVAGHPQVVNPQVDTLRLRDGYVRFTVSTAGLTPEGIGAVLGVIEQELTK